MNFSRRASFVVSSLRGIGIRTGILLLACIVFVAFLAFAQRAPVSQEVQLALVDREGRRSPVGPLPQATFAPRISPDGKEVVFDTQDDGHVWIAYVSAQTGRLEVYVRPSAGTGTAVQISKAGGGHPLWAPDQKELYFDNNGRMFAAAISTQPSFKAETPAALPITGFIQGPLRREYDLMPDGKHFLMMFPPGR